jgi:sporulation protein YlmC with PRC-barrel domain
MMKLTALALGTFVLSAPVLAQSTQLMGTIPSQSVTVADWYKQSVHDSSHSKIGEVMDVLLTPDGRVGALIVGVGGFLGIGEKDVAVPFNAIKHSTRDCKVHLTLDTTKAALKNAAGLKYDRSTTSWVPDSK